jgi:hypothetical protein
MLRQGYEICLLPGQRRHLSLFGTILAGAEDSRQAGRPGVQNTPVGGDACSGPKQRWRQPEDGKICAEATEW